MITDIKTEMGIINNGGFWCLGCLTGKPAAEISPDPRYCQGCYDFLKKESLLLHPKSRPAWIPKNTVKEMPPEPPETSPDAKNDVSKINVGETCPPAIMKQRKRGRGRPRKAKGKISRVTDWRRRKKGQAVLL